MSHSTHRSMNILQLAILQGSGISNVDVGSATIKLNDDGIYTLLFGAADMGTGCDTTLSQIAAECLNCDLEDITVLAADTDSSPYDSGSYASSTAYVTGKAVELACTKLIKRFKKFAAPLLGRDYKDLEFDGKRVYYPETDESISLMDIATKSMCGNEQALEVTVSHSSPVSPPPFMVGMAEIELDKETGAYELIDYVLLHELVHTVEKNHGEGFWARLLIHMPDARVRNKVLKSRKVI